MAVNLNLVDVIMNWLMISVIEKIISGRVGATDIRRLLSPFEHEIEEPSRHTVTEAAIILVGIGQPQVRSRRPSRLQTKLGGPGPSRHRSMATPGSSDVGHRPGVLQEVRGPP